MDKQTQKYVETNRDLWNLWTKMHEQSDFYDLDGFKAGKTSLAPIEIDEIGDVTGKSLLHLQCHFGLDTLSWARAGAKVTGVDFSKNAISLAMSLSEDLGIEANFICSEILDLPKTLDERFDIVFTSYGVLSWLNDINGWAKTISHYLKPGGVFYIVEFHPVLGMMDDDGKYISYPYFHSQEPMKFVEEGSYADPKSNVSHDLYQWTHSLSDVINALLTSGLKLQFVHEFPYSVHNCYPFFKEEEPGRYIMKDYPNIIPIMFSIKATT